MEPKFGGRRGVTHGRSERDHRRSRRRSRWLPVDRIFGPRAAYRWDDLKRRRESDLSDRVRFYRIYGEFFAVWKAWDTHLTRPGIHAPSDAQWELLNRAAHVEGEFEALLVKVVSERQLGDQEVRLLACYRQAYQRLRERIREGCRLEWWATNKPGRGTGYREYQTLKAPSAWFGDLLAREDGARGRFCASKSDPRSDAAIRRLFCVPRSDPQPDAGIRRILGATVVVVDWEPEARRLLALDPIVDGRRRPR